MNYVVFKTGNPFEAMIAAALCSSDIVKGIAIDPRGMKFTDKGEYEIDFKVLAGKMNLSVVEFETDATDEAEISDIKTEGSVKVAEKTKPKFIIFPGCLPKNTDDVTIVKIENFMETCNTFCVSGYVSAPVYEELKYANSIILGAQDDTDLLTEEEAQNANQMFIIFSKFFKKPAEVRDTLHRYLCMGLGKVNLIKKLVSMYPAINLGEYKFYRSYEFIGPLIERELEAGNKIAVFRDNTGESNGEKPVVILFLFADSVPSEFAGLEFIDSVDPLVGKKCKVATVPMTFWANVMANAKK